MLAHKVILKKLESRASLLKYAANLTKISQTREILLLIELLEEMDMSDEHRAEVVSQLPKIDEKCNSSDITDEIKQLINKLST